MKPHVSVTIDPLGRPVAEMLPAWNWMSNLVDYLAENRLPVAYEFNQTWFRVTFLQHAPSDVQNLLGRWSELQSDECKDIPRALCRKECKHASSFGCQN